MKLNIRLVKRRLKNYIFLIFFGFSSCVSSKEAINNDTILIRMSGYNRFIIKRHGEEIIPPKIEELPQGNDSDIVYEPLPEIKDVNKAINEDQVEQGVASPI